MSAFARPSVALGFGFFLLCAETCRHLDSLLALPQSWLTLPIPDWGAGLFLVWAGVRSRRDWATGQPLQAAAWAFNLSLLSTAFFAHLESWPSEVPAEREWVSEPVLISIIGALLIVAGCSLVSTLRLPRTLALPDQRA
jgi:hypothetical protein